MPAKPICTPCNSKRKGQIINLLVIALIALYVDLIITSLPFPDSVMLSGAIALSALAAWAIATFSAGYAIIRLIWRF